MTLEELEKKLAKLEDLHAELKAQIAELKARDEEPPKPRDEEPPKPPHPRWKPAPGELFYGNKGDMAWDWSLWDSTDGYKLGCYSWGNAYKTKGEAIFAAERLKTIAEMREWAGNWDDTFVLTYIGNDDIVSFNTVLTFRNTFGEMRFATRKDAENCIKAVGEDRIKKYYFMIPEDTE